MLIDDALATGARDRLYAAGLCGGNVEVDRGEPTDNDALPLANVYVVADDATAEGDARTGISRFVHKTTLVVDLVHHGNTRRAVKAWLAAVGEGLMQELCSDLSWGALDGKPIIEGVDGVRRLYTYEPKGEAIVGRLQLQIFVLTRSHWEPGTSSLAELSTMSVGFDLANGDDPPAIGAEINVPTTP